MANYISREDLTILKDMFIKFLNSRNMDYTIREQMYINELNNTIDTFSSFKQEQLLDLVNIIVNYCKTSVNKPIIDILNFRKDIGNRLVKTSAMEINSKANNMVSQLYYSIHENERREDFRLENILYSSDTSTNEYNIKKYMLMMENRASQDADNIVWIPCNIAMPENPGTYLVAVKDGCHGDCTYGVDVADSHGNYIDDFWNTSIDWYEGQEVHVTHWAYIPINPMRYKTILNEIYKSKHIDMEE